MALNDPWAIELLGHSACPTEDTEVLLKGISKPVGVCRLRVAEPQAAPPAVEAMATSTD